MSSRSRFWYGIVLLVILIVASIVAMLTGDTGLSMVANRGAFIVIAACLTVLGYDYFQREETKE